MVDLREALVCKNCNGTHFTARYEATYLYTYKIDTTNIHVSEYNREEFLPYLFDNREQMGSNQYIECDHCNAKYPCFFGLDSKGIEFTIVQKAIRSDYVSKPEFWG